MALLDAVSESTTIGAVMQRQPRAQKKAGYGVTKCRFFATAFGFVQARVFSCACCVVCCVVCCVLRFPRCVRVYVCPCVVVVRCVTCCCVVRGGVGDGGWRYVSDWVCVVWRWCASGGGSCGGGGPRAKRQWEVEEGSEDFPRLDRLGQCALTRVHNDGEASQQEQRQKVRQNSPAPVKDCRKEYGGVHLAPLEQGQHKASADKNDFGTIFKLIYRLSCELFLHWIFARMGNNTKCVQVRRAQCKLFSRDPT